MQNKVQFLNLVQHLGAVEVMLMLKSLEGLITGRFKQMRRALLVQSNMFSTN